MPLTTAGKNNLISITSFTHATAFQDLGVTETTPVTRLATTWAAAASGARAISAQLSIAIAAGQTIQAVGVYDALTGGNSQGFWQIGSSLRGGASVTTADTFTSVAHGLAADNRVFFSTVGGDALPAGISATTLYFVRATGLTADAFSVSTTSGGAALDITAAGEASWYRTVPQTFAIAGNLILPATTGIVIDANAFG